MKSKISLVLFFSYLFLVHTNVQAQRVILPGQIVQVNPGEPIPMVPGEIIQINPSLNQSQEYIPSSNTQQEVVSQNYAQSTIQGCQCYCSDLCGPRQMHEGDAPFIDSETGICFCQQRDKDNYIPHQCNIKNPNPVIEQSCCAIR